MQTNVDILRAFYDVLCFAAKESVYPREIVTVPRSGTISIRI